MLGLIGLLLTGLLIALVALTAFTVHMLTHPPRRTYASALAKGRPGDPSELPTGPSGTVRPSRSWTFVSQNRSLPVWDITGDDPRGPVLVLTHGWGDSRIGGLSRVGPLAPAVSRIILWDMPGQGDAPGTCSLGVRELIDLRALLASIGSNTPIVLHGWSLGAGISLALAADTSLGIVGVIAESPYRLAHTPARNVIALMGYPWRINLPIAMALLGWEFGVGRDWATFDRATDASRASCPILVLHGTADDVSPIEDGRAIAAAAKHATLCELPEEGHHGLWSGDHAELCARSCAQFLRAVVTPETRSIPAETHPVEAPSANSL